MEKKAAKKLALNRETVRTLEKGELAAAAVGGGSTSCAMNCQSGSCDWSLCICQ